jgi:glycosyltransferase involved in cell wall biosynthesis
MEFHQVLVSAAPGDAITNSAFELRTLLRRIGPSEIYARFFDASLAGEVVPLKRYALRRSPRPDRDVLLFHASIGEPDVMAFLRERPERLVLVYHNMSPAEPFREFDPAFAGLLESGRVELGALRDRVAMALAVSEYNAAELQALGYRDVRVAPLIIDAGRLHRTTPDEATAHHLEAAVEGPVVLFVGQLLPHKRPDFLLQAYHALVTYLRPNVNLVIVGTGRLPRFTAALHSYAHELNLHRAWLTGRVSDEQLAAFYERADVFVTASEHEGFCVPLLEAMSFGVPVVARAFAAIPETLGGAGLLLPPEPSPFLMAEAVDAVLGDERLRRSLVAGQVARLPAFDPDQARATVLAHLESVV